MHILTLLNQKDFIITNIGYSNFLAKGAATLVLFYHTILVGGEGGEGRY